MMPTIDRAERKWALLVAALIVALASLPYLLGWALTPAGDHFTGLLINPIDGHSYLAKMGQGARGNWLFRLPYTAEAHEPVLLFTFHLLLGRLAVGGSPGAVLGVYHLARVFFGLALLVGVYGAAAFFSHDIGQRRLTLLLVGLSSGFGWLFGSTPDLTVPESVTFASLLINAHFGLTFLLILLLVLAITLAPRHWSSWAAVVVGSVALVMIHPFAVLIVGVAAGGWLLVRWIGEKSLAWLPLGRLALFSACALPFIAYFAWISQNHSVMHRWMAQNITLSPPFWQWLAAYGLLWPLAAAGAWRALQRRRPADWLLLTWALGQLALMIVPFSLQRRMSTGLHLPLCFLAAVGLWEIVLPRLRGRVKRWVAPAVLLFSFPSNLLMMLAGISAVVGQNPYVVLSEAQWEAMAWLRDNVSSETVVLADEELGTVVPAWGKGARVIYGHPFETLDADQTRQMVNDFFAGAMPAERRASLLDDWGVEIVIVQQDRYSVERPAGYLEVWRLDPLVIFRREDS